MIKHYVNIHLGIDTLSGSNAASTTGEISIKMGDYYFPEKTWNDFPDIILQWWLTEVIRYSQDGELPIKLGFMDGPFCCLVTVDENDEGVISCYEDNALVDTANIDIELLVRDVYTAVTALVNACNTNSLLTPGVKKLEVLIREHRNLAKRNPGHPKN